MADGEQGAQGDPGQAGADGSDCTVSPAAGLLITREEQTQVCGAQGAQGHGRQVKPVPTVQIAL